MFYTLKEKALKHFISSRQFNCIILIVCIIFKQLMFCKRFVTSLALVENCALRSENQVHG